MAEHGRRGRQVLQLSIGLVISGVSIWLLLRQIDVRLVRDALSQAQWPLLLASAGMYFVAMTTRAWRWTFLLRPIKWLNLRQLWPVTAIGYASNLILPARLGEIVRAAVLRTRGVPMSGGLATIATERIVDGLATVAIVLLTLPLLPGTAPQWLITGGRVVGFVFGAGLIVLWVMLMARPVVARVLDRLGALFPPLARPGAWALRFIDGLGALRIPGLFAATLILTALAWVFSITEYWLAMRAMGVYLSPAAAAFCVSAIGLSSAIPAAPGYVGTQELVGVTVLGLWGVPPVTALAASLAFHVVEIVPIGIVGLIVAWREGTGASGRPPIQTAGHEQAAISGVVSADAGPGGPSA